MMVKRGFEKKGQVTIFVILAIAIIAIAALFFVFRSSIFPNSVPSTFSPIENQLLSCIKTQTQNGVKVLESQGGYINPPSFVPGSSYMPFSSQLNFLGLEIPYWHTISGNNIAINNEPTKASMQKQLSDYIESQIQNCDLNSFRSQGYTINEGNSTVQTSIEDNSVKVFLNMKLNIVKGSQSDTITNHQVQVDTQLGNLFNDAVKFNSLEKSQGFLENYSVDFLNNYAPVNGFILSCSPHTWNANQIFDTLKNATQGNFEAIKNNGPKNDYFALHLPISSSVRVLNLESWPSTYEVEGTNSPTLIAKPIGNQQGLGIIGFCYVPYHFVYNIKYPVLIQLTKNNETFQFPMPIIIDGNVAKNTANSTAAPANNFDLCSQAANSTAPVKINLIDSNGKPLNGNISYECLGSTCQIGSTKNGEISANFPQCVNGKVIIYSEGYKEASQTLTTVNGGNATVYLNKIYKVPVNLNLTNSEGNEKAIITFTANDTSSQTVLYPAQKTVNLSEGNYSIQVYVYDNSSIKFNATTTQQCSNVPSGVIGGIFGITHKVCNTVNIPAQNISQVLVAGGSSSIYISGNELANSKGIELDVNRYKTPSTIQELEIIYTLVNAKTIGAKLE